MRKVEGRVRKECTRPGENVATLNIEAYSLSMWRLFVIGMVKSMEKTGKKSATRNWTISGAILGVLIFNIQYSHHLSLCFSRHCYPTVPSPLITILWNLLLLVRAELHCLWAIYTIPCVLQPSKLAERGLYQSISAHKYWLAVEERLFWWWRSFEIFVSESGCGQPWYLLFARTGTRGMIFKLRPVLVRNLSSPLFVHTMSAKRLWSFTALQLYVMNPWAYIIPFHLFISFCALHLCQSVRSIRVPDRSPIQ